LIHLYAMPNLRYINLKRCPVTQAAVKRLSDALPGCVIDWEPLRFLADGKVDSAAARKGRIELGRRIPQDPRGSRRAAPPMDSAPVQSLPTWSVQPSGQNVRPYNGFLLDVF
jgi:hypothetical protein